MHNNFRCKDEENVLEQAQGESEASPIMSVFHDLQAVSVEINIPIEVHGVESLHWDLVASMVLGLVGRVLEGKVVLDWATWVPGLLILARAEGRCHIPEADQDRDSGEDTEKDGGLHSTTNLPGHVCWDTSDESEEEEVGEAGVASGICRERGIFDCWVLPIVS